MALLITGAAGFIGSHLLERAAETEDNIIAIDNFDPFYAESIKRRNLEVALKNKNVKLYETDIRDIENCRKIFKSEGIDRVVHLAAKAGVRPSLENPQEYEDVNCRGTLTMLELSREFGIKKFVFGSSSSVYGNNVAQPFSEEHTTDNPISPYGATKKSGEHFCRSYNLIHGMPIVCLRFFTVYGPRQRPDLAIHKFARLIIKGKPIPVYGDGSSKRDYTFFSDIVDGIMAALKLNSDFEIINLGDSNPVELKQLIDLLETLLGKKAVIEKMDDQPGDARLTYADISKADRLLGYKPKVKIEAGLEIFSKWIKENA